MFGKFMNNFYYGKSGKGDYNPEDLPQNRWQLFWEMLKIRLSALCRLNLMYVIAWVPLLLVVLSAAGEWINIAVALTDQQELMLAGGSAAEEAATVISGLNDYTRALILRTLLFAIPCIAITGPATAGAAYITRNWARDEHAFIWSDFRDAIKENWKQALGISAITSVMPVVLYVCWMFYGEMAVENMLFIIPQVLSVTIALIWLCSLLYMYPLMVTYQLSFRDLLRNGLLLTVGRLPMTLGLKLLSLVPIIMIVLLALFAGVQWAFIVALAYYVIIGYALSRFVSASYTNAVFDRFINPNIAGAQVGRGLYNTEDDEDDEDDQGDATEDIEEDSLTGKDEA